ncbi:MAG: alkylation response protein AidB-like acyl-CoA dehydrogenase [Gammaproteobacteria bacterium]
MLGPHAAKLENNLMPTYSAPLGDMKFVLRELFAGERDDALPGTEDFSDDVIDAVLEEAAKLSETVLAPLNRSGDEEGCTFDNGVVRTPMGFKEAYAQFIAGGWTGLSGDPAYGGQDLPQSIGLLVSEMNSSANLAFTMYPGLSHGAYEALHKWGTPELKSRYLPKLVDGSWSGTMCLTEAHCGTDLGLIRTRAEAHADGSFAITGTKIFISAGEHDLTENILHLVLARLPDAPDGVAGISLFLVPKVLPNADGSVGQRNGVACGALEHKMGIKASSTCVMNFDAATGFLVGSAHKGMRAMFTMMNGARLAVGVQGLSVAEASYQGAVAYARERLQGRALTGAQSPQQPADSILVHADVRRMLLAMRANIEGGRALVAWVAHELDVSERHTDPLRREAAGELVSLLTPIVKAHLTDLGSECANLGVQVLGGHGYIREHGMEQLIRDARICQIYEGTNGIQAMDLVGRKLAQRAGRLLRHFFHPVSLYLSENANNEELAAFIAPLAKVFGRLQQATGMLAQRGLKNPDEAAAAASEYLRLFALVAMAYLWCRAVEAAQRGGAQSDNFYRAKLSTARFFYERILPQSGALFAAIMGGAGAINEFIADDF